MKKVLIIANLFHASPRIPALIKYLKEFGWEAKIVSPRKKEAAGLEIVEAPYRGDILWFLRKLFSFLGFRKNGSITEQVKEKFGVPAKKTFFDRILYTYQAIFGYPDTEKYWIKPALKAASEALKKEKFDAILSSSPYPTSHLVAKKAKEGFRLPWLADFRDPWSQNHDYPYPNWRKKLDEKLELKTIKIADAVVAASPSYAKKQSDFHKREVKVVINGFDPEVLRGLKPAPTKKFTITYTGTIYAQKQDPTKILKAVSELIKEKKIKPEDIEIGFYGPKYSWLELEIKKYSIDRVATQHGILSKEESIQKQRESQILLLLCWEDPAETGVYPQKIFEYLGAQRPVLATGGTPQEDVKKIIEEVRAGASAMSTEEIKQKLLEFYNEYKKEGLVRYRGNPDKIEQYSYRSMAKKFSDILNQVTENG